MNFAESITPPDGSVRLELRFGKEVKTFNGEDTLVRRFAVGDGTYDHCVHILPSGNTVAFTPTREALDRFVELGFPVRDDNELDEATIEHYARVQAAHIDEEIL